MKGMLSSLVAPPLTPDTDMVIVSNHFTGPTLLVAQTEMNLNCSMSPFE